MDLNSILLFSEVAQAGSFTAAAKKLGIPKSTLSGKIADLEKDLGVSLMTRTTRKLSLTEAGEIYFHQSRRALEELHSAQDQASSAQSSPQGLLRITAPEQMSGSGLTDAICVPLGLFKNLSVEFIFTDRVVDLVAEGIDIAIRAGKLEDTTAIAKKMGTSRFLVVASPAYLKKWGHPQHPQDLIRHSCLKFQPTEEIWELKGIGEKQTVKIRGRVTANSITALKQMALLGQGVALIPAFTAAPELALGKLVRILPQWSTEAEPLYLVYPAQRFVPAKVREVVPHLVRSLQEFISDKSHL